MVEAGHDTAPSVHNETLHLARQAAQSSVNGRAALNNGYTLFGRQGNVYRGFNVPDGGKRLRHCPDHQPPRRTDTNLLHLKDCRSQAHKAVPPPV
jgi:hypothetical protein